MPENDMEASLYNIPLGFHFMVEFDPKDEKGNDRNKNLGNNDKDIRFQEVTGLTAELGIENYDEGGENRFSHRLPTRAKFNNLVLKRGLLFDTELHKWFEDALSGFIFNPVDIRVTLLNEEQKALEAWNFHNVWPVKWTISDFKASENALVIETLELAYQYFNRANYETKN